MNFHDRCRHGDQTHGVRHDGANADVEVDTRHTIDVAAPQHRLADLRALLGIQARRTRAGAGPGLSGPGSSLALAGLLSGATFGLALLGASLALAGRGAALGLALLGATLGLALMGLPGLPALATLVCTLAPLHLGLARAAFGRTSGSLAGGSTTGRSAAVHL